MATLKEISDRFTRLRVDDWREDADKFLTQGIALVEHGIAIDADPARLHDIAGFVRDIVSDMEGGMQKELDTHGLVDEFRPLDTSQLDELLAKMAKA